MKNSIFYLTINETKQVSGGGDNVSNGQAFEVLTGTPRLPSNFIMNGVFNVLWENGFIDILSRFKHRPPRPSPN